MGLAIGVHVGDKFYLNDVPVTVRSLTGYEAATVEIKGKIFELTDKASIEVYPEVFLSCGHPNNGRLEKYEALPRIMVDAPLTIVILREDLYLRKQYANNKVSYSTHD